MSNIYSKVTFEKKWFTLNFDFLSSSPGQFLGTPTHADMTDF